MKPIKIDLTVACSGDPENCLIADCVECGAGEGRLWHAIVSHLVIHHPMPWTIDHDWTTEVIDAKGMPVVKSVTDEDARKLIALAESQRKRMDESSAVLDAEFAADLAEYDAGRAELAKPREGG